MGNFLANVDWSFALTAVFRLLLSVTIGTLIGSERARHGRAAGMRTHILVCLGAALTSLMSLYVSHALGAGGDVLRIPAQVISGIGFLGAGMIILKNNTTIVGLTTAAGVWTTSIIGIAVGYGFYIGAVAATVLFLVATVFLQRFEKRKNSTEVLYIEIDDMYKTNDLLKVINELAGVDASHYVVPPKSGQQGHLG
ncbi:MAG: MgtC/SapB family protein, partial [Clostridia bacterium]|nr:MgtC/SapB family protein [Clostridia bacterium]